MKVLYICISTGPASIPAEIADAINALSESISVDIAALGGDGTNADYEIPSLLSPGGLVSLTKLLVRTKFDVVHVHPNAKGVVAALPARVFTDAVVVSHEHTDRSRQDRVRQAMAVMRDALSDTIISNSKATQTAHESLIEKLPEALSAKQALIHNGVALQSIEKTSPSDYGRDQIPLLAVASRIAPEKDFETLLDGIAEVWRRGHELDIVILGDRSDVDLIESWADEYNNRYVHAPGEVGRRTVWSVFREAEFTASASRREGFAVAVVEAMAAGAVPIVSDIAAHREVLGDAGSKFPVGEPKSFADEFEAILEDEDGLNAEFDAAMQRAAEFDLQSTATDHVDLYEKLH